MLRLKNMETFSLRNFLFSFFSVRRLFFVGALAFLLIAIQTTHAITPDPNIISITPQSAVEGTNITLIVNGSDFISGAVIRVGNTTLSTNFFSTSQLNAPMTVPAAGSYQVTVTNPSPNAGTSQPVTFTSTVSGSTLGCTTNADCGSNGICSNGSCTPGTIECTT